MRDPWNDSELVQRVETHQRYSLTRAPLNAALCGVIARDRSLHTLLAHAPVEQQLPVLLLAAIHFLVIGEPDHELAAWYPNLTSDFRDPADPALARVLHDFVNDRGPSMLDLLATRRVQTNEVGRCALFLPALALIAADRTPIGHIDVGTSAGLTTLLPRFAYRYDVDEAGGDEGAGDGEEVGAGASGDVIGDGQPLLVCSTRGAVPVPTEIPTIARARGIDLDPIDITDPDDARWLRACCWPDQIDRFERLAAAIEMARTDPPEIVAGDAVAVIRDTIDTLPSDQHPVVTCSWALNYLTADARRAFVAELDAAGAARDLSWVFAESPALAPELPHAPDLRGEHTTALVLVRWREGERQVDHLATGHPHGYWLHWR
ncbi:MAG: DUF2332 domain-containing protein [Ilumatobacter sp.]|uniref:DUF2332 domain-containing protein n=1 Tax=Ilumatobacter sp. TaxID=1967498 RepID=UPI003C7232C1